MHCLSLESHSTENNFCNRLALRPESFYKGEDRIRDLSGNRKRKSDQPAVFSFESHNSQMSLFLLLAADLTCLQSFSDSDETSRDF